MSKPNSVPAADKLDAAVSFDQFAEGDVAVFTRSFEQDSFDAFSTLSGDENPLHHDAVYAGTTQFQRPIVPLHMTLAPLSMVAGMIFPGKPSLYLGHEVRAAGPIYYGESLTYSARIEAINRATRVLRIRVLGLRGTDVVLDTQMRVQAISELWTAGPTAVAVEKTAGNGRAVVTGAAGAIGSATALALAKAGWSLLLQDRGPDERRAALCSALDRLSANYDVVSADLSDGAGHAALAAAARSHGDVELVAHTASAGVSAPLTELVATNFGTLHRLGEAVLPTMLARQKGRFVFVSSSAVSRRVPGWDDYIAAKAMTSDYVAGLDQRFSAYGVRGMSVLPGFVSTRFSDAFRGDAPALTPQELASEIRAMAETPGQTAVLLEVGRRSEGSFGFHPAAVGRRDAEAKEAHHLAGGTGAPGTASSQRANGSAETIAEVVRRSLRLPQTARLSGAGLGVTPGWDSLKQIELVLDLEAAFGVSFNASEIAALTQFEDLSRSIQTKIGRT